MFNQFQACISMIAAFSFAISALEIVFWSAHISLVLRLKPQKVSAHFVKADRFLLNIWIKKDRGPSW